MPKAEALTQVRKPPRLDASAIARIVDADPDLAERAAIKEYDGGMTRPQAERSALRERMAERETTNQKGR